MPVAEQVTAKATLKGKEEVEDGYKLTLDVPAFKSKYPVVVYGAAADDAAPLKVGTQYDLVLVRGKKGKDSYSGETYWHWNWRWGGIATGPSPEAPAPPPPKPDYEERMDAARPSIEAQTALNAAKDIAVAFISSESPADLSIETVMELVDEWARAAYATIQALKTGSPPAPSAPAAQERPPAPQQAPGQPASPPKAAGGATAPVLRHRGDVLTAAKNEFGMSPQEVYARLNIDSIEGIADLATAYKTLREQREQEAQQQAKDAQKKEERPV
jgi:hypothetical protein